jgi:hypothetical protein
VNFGRIFVLIPEQKHEMGRFGIHCCDRLATAHSFKAETWKSLALAKWSPSNPRQP